MKKYRLKKEAVPFFKAKYSTSIHPLDMWDSLGIDMKALEEVEDIYITYGIKKDESLTTFSGWHCEKGSSFEFTVHFPSMKYIEHDRFSNGKITREMMNKIQSCLNRFYDDFVNVENPVE